MKVIKEVELGGKIISIETGRFAKQANGSVMVRCGDTMVLVTAVAAEEPKQDIDYFPLQVEYREKTSAAGKFPGGYIKREGGRPSEKEILTSRLIDRPLRPLFPSDYYNETQIMASVYSFDGENDADVLAAVGASAALAISDIPFDGPMGEVRIGRVNGELIVNPTHKQIKESDIELIVGGTADSILMVEGESKEVDEDDLLAALKFAQQEIKKLVQLQNELREAVGRQKKEVKPKEVDENLKKEIYDLAEKNFKEIVHAVLSKDERSSRNKALNTSVKESLAEKYPEQEKVIGEILHDLEKDLMRKRILDEGKRLDGRDTNQVRPITIEVGVLPRTHGSALFTRGETQSLTSLTLGTKSDEQTVDGLIEEYSKKFMLHYNFPPFSVGEVGRLGTGRREIGHGNLAERALKIVVPQSETFPYTMRLISDILESNGSSSMASVCAGSLALMDGGVPITKAVAGIAMGLVKEGDKFAVLSDILGNEDHLGDMDFKVAGTADGITAFQMDIKIQGISFEIMETALRQAKDGRLHILDVMNQTLREQRDQLSSYAPRLLTMKVETDQIGLIIGPGGKTIQGMQRLFGVDINIDDDGTVSIASPNRENAAKCKEYIKKMTATPEVGEVYDGVITKIMDFGAFVEILPGKEGLLHISQIDNKRVNKVTDYFKEGDKVTVKLLKIENGKYSLSRKELITEENRQPSPESNS
jgi:polyribonucleotide nucleotidyltransferase